MDSFLLVIAYNCPPVAENVKNCCNYMNKARKPPRKHVKGNTPANTKLQDLLNLVQRILPDHFKLNDTSFRYTTRAHHLVLLKLSEQTVDMVDKPIEEVISESKVTKMAKSRVGTYATTIKELLGNRTKHRGIQQSSIPRTVWPWLTKLVLVVVNQYRLRAGRKPLQIDSEDIMESSIGAGTWKPSTTTEVLAECPLQVWCPNLGAVQSIENKAAGQCLRTGLAYGNQ